MGVVFYNAGDKIEEHLRCSMGPADKDANFLAYWHLLAPKEDFFEVPTELEVASSGETVAVQFAQDITRRFGARGVIRIKPDYDAKKEDPERELTTYPFASTREEAIARGNAIWTEYLRKVVQGHLDDCEAARAAGGAPKSAVGFTKRALKLLEITDPGQQYFSSLSKGPVKPSDPAVARLEGQNQLMMALLMQMLQGKTVDPEQVAKLQAGNGTGAPAESPVTSGVMTGDVKKPVSTTEAVPAKTRAERSRAAMDELKGQ